MTEGTPDRLTMQQEMNAHDAVAELGDQLGKDDATIYEKIPQLKDFSGKVKFTGGDRVTYPLTALVPAPFNIHGYDETGTELWSVTIMPEWEVAGSDGEPLQGQWLTREEAEPYREYSPDDFDVIEHEAVPQDVEGIIKKVKQFKEKMKKSTE